jgi:Lar family restriction alleviation protein
MSNSTDLLPCPFCGEAALLIEGHREHWRAQCSKCGANIGEFFANRSRQEDQRLATEAWNTRTPDPEAARLREALEKCRTETIEECARVALSQRCGFNNPWDGACVDVAAAIRALSPHPDGERG